MRGEDAEALLCSVRISGLHVSVFMANKKTVASWRRRWGSRNLRMETKRKASWIVFCEFGKGGKKCWARDT